MLGENIAALRKKQGMSQEKLAEELGVSRQTIAKWEVGNSVPDLVLAAKLATFFDISLEDLMNLEVDYLTPDLPRGEYIFGRVQVNDKGQITLPARARKIFHIKAGSELLLLGDINQGLALMDTRFFLEGFKAVVENEENES
ncbi:helix-turn-helix domain-containing protein [Streptococcus massiliensis]|uniref:Cro/CI family transcriptional regulator putative n=1 Tax=Streptococcus massiliensis TaxID=313439 RepID=A0A380KV90_9STRE|nr:helix-turn-helix domain-containing protein [Streptococcus massiliensis]SUN75822.1 Cro/CI family transcriptional regulator putative [Streptococcus massiliensis]